MFPHVQKARPKRITTTDALIVFRSEIEGRRNRKTCREPMYWQRKKGFRLLRIYRTIFKLISI